MWSSKRGVRRALPGPLALLLAPLALGGCRPHHVPVYGDNGIGVEQHELRYAKPANRLEQIIYQELALRLGKADPAAPCRCDGHHDEARRGA